MKRTFAVLVLAVTISAAGTAQVKLSGHEERRATILHLVDELTSKQERFLDPYDQLTQAASIQDGGPVASDPKPQLPPAPPFLEARLEKDNAQRSLELQFPENPQPVKRSQFGGYQIDKDKVVKEPKILTKKFLFAHGAYLAATVFDIETTHQGLAHHRCVEGGDGIAEAHVSRGELYLNDLIVFGALTGIDLMMASQHLPKLFFWLPYMGSTAGTVGHLRGGIRWYTQCW